MKRLALWASLALACVAPASADDFYRGKTITLAVGTPAGGGYDLFGRIVARHIGKFIPGAPAVVVQNMPGAAGIRISNHLYAAAPKDGTFLAATLNNVPLNQFLAPDQAKYRAEQMHWIGSGDLPAHVLMTWHTTGVTTLQDATKREIATGVSAPGTAMEMYPTLANNLFGTKFKLIGGYQGSGDVMLAIERGEIEAIGSTGWVDIVTRKPDWISDKKIFPLFQMTLKRDRLLPDLPTMLELAKTEEQRQVVTILSIVERIGRPLIAPPGTPPERVAMLRKAFADMVATPEFAEDSRAAGFDVDAVLGEELRAMVERVTSTPPDIVERFRATVTPPSAPR